MPGSQHILIDLSSWSKSALSPKVERICGAIECGRLLSFRYFAPKGESFRSIEPYYLIFHWASWYVWGYCRDRKDYRLFKLGRMTELQVGEAFEKRQAPFPDLTSEKIFPHVHLVKALIDPEYRWRLVEEYGPDSYTVQEDGRLLFSSGFTDEESILDKADEKAVRLYTDYDGGADEDYTAMVCCAIKQESRHSEYEIRRIPAGSYAKFVISCNMDTAVAEVAKT